MIFLNYKLYYMIRSGNKNRNTAHNLIETEWDPRPQL